MSGSPCPNSIPIALLTKERLAAWSCGDDGAAVTSPVSAPLKPIKKVAEAYLLLQYWVERTAGGTSLVRYYPAEDDKVAALGQADLTTGKLRKSWFVPPRGGSITAMVAEPASRCALVVSALDRYNNRLRLYDYSPPAEPLDLSAAKPVLDLRVFGGFTNGLEAAGGSMRCVRSEAGDLALIAAELVLVETPRGPVAPQPPQYELVVRQGTERRVLVRSSGDYRVLQGNGKIIGVIEWATGDALVASAEGLVERIAPQPGFRWLAFDAVSRSGVQAPAQHDAFGELLFVRDSGAQIAHRLYISQGTAIDRTVADAPGAFLIRAPVINAPAHDRHLMAPGVNIAWFN